MITLRFDDGKKTQYNVGFKYMKKTNIRGVIFPIGKYIENESLDKYNQYIGKTEILELCDAGWEIGYHSYSHSKNLIDMNWKEETNCKIIKDMGINCTSFCFPYSKYNDDIVDYLYNNNYKNLVGRPSSALNNEKNMGKVYNSYTMNKNTTIEQIQKLINNSILQKKYLILCFHEIVSNDKIINENDGCTIKEKLFFDVIDLINKKKKKLKVVTLEEYSHYRDYFTS